MTTRGESTTVAPATNGTTSTDASLGSLDPKQVALLDEPCIVLDRNDRPIGARSKKDCHLMKNIRTGLLHRAFSVFLFNSKGELLVQQRSDEKITFPGCYTNTCCSHPLAIPSEMTDDPIVGVKRAAQRRVFIELGIPPEELPIESLEYLTRIHYMSPSNGEWGEHEIDYILFCKRDVATVAPNPNEIKSWRYVSRNEITQFIRSMDEKGVPITPWFRLILDSLLLKWWDNLDNLQPFKDHNTIHRFS